MKSKIKVYDAIMGSGKTHNAIERMKGYLKEGKKFIYVTPFLSEIERIEEKLNSDEVYSPKNLGEPDFNGFEYEEVLIDENGKIDLNAEGTLKILNKRAQFIKMVNMGKNIISTHSLFMSLNKNDLSLFSDYILILDEVVNPMKVHFMGKVDIQILKNQELIVIDNNTREVRFVNEDYHDPAFKTVKKLCNNNTVFHLDEYFFVWVFPIEIFKEFKEIQVLTYLFEGSLLCAYFKLFGFGYELISGSNDKQLMKIKSLLNVYDGRIDDGLISFSFSKTWIKNLNKHRAKKICETTSYVLKKVFKTKSNENAFTTFKDSRNKLSGNSYSKGFIPINSRATNNYRNKKSMAYLGNRYFDPQTQHFFKQRGIDLNEDLWALGELIQWVWRGCIRDDKPMNIYIPNSRMRNLLLGWMNGEFNYNSTKEQLRIAG
jgi:hypothetical protein